MARGRYRSRPNASKMVDLALDLARFRFIVTVCYDGQCAIDLKFLYQSFLVETSAMINLTRTDSIRSNAFQLKYLELICDPEEMVEAVILDAFNIPMTNLDHFAQHVSRARSKFRPSEAHCLLQ